MNQPTIKLAPSVRIVLDTMRRLLARGPAALSIKEVSIEAAVSGRTASRALTALVAAGLITRSHWNTRPAPTWSMKQ